MVSGLQDLVVLKSTGSEFKGFLVDEFTTLAETDDRILATSLVARWRHDSADRLWAGSTGTRRTTRCATCCCRPSPRRTPGPSQETLYLMGSAVVDTLPGIAEVRFAAPNKHHFLVDFSGFDVEGLENNGEVFIAADRPYGLIECQVTRDEAGPADDAWLACRSSDGTRREQLLGCLSVPRWADDVLAGQPYADRDALVAAPTRRRGR